MVYNSRHRTPSVGLLEHAPRPDVVRADDGRDLSITVFEPVQQVRGVAVMALPSLTSGISRTLLGWFIELCMLGTSLFLLYFGWELVKTTWNQVMAQMPVIPVGLTYAPIPIGGGIIALFVIERLWSGRFFAPAEADPPFQSAQTPDAN